MSCLFTFSMSATKGKWSKFSKNQLAAHQQQPNTKFSNITFLTTEDSEVMHVHKLLTQNNICSGTNLTVWIVSWLQRLFQEILENTNVEALKLGHKNS